VLSLLGIQTTIQRWVQSTKERIRLAPIRFTVTTAVVVLGLFLRARGFLFDRHGLWLDEASWAMMVVRDPLVTLLIRPIGFMSVAKVLALVFGPYEVVLRLESWLAGVGLVLLAPALGARLFRTPAARLLFVGVIALHPAAIDMSKEFKPYSVSLFGHMAVLHLVLRYLDTQRARHLVEALVAAAVAGLFAQDLVMTYPAVFLVLGWDTLRHQRHRLTWVMGGAFVILLMLGAQYWFIWRNLETSAETTYWGHKYDVFYTKGPRHSHFKWWLEHYRAIAVSPGLRSKYWDAILSREELRSLSFYDNVVWEVIQAAGIVAIFALRRFREAVLLLLPFATITLMNGLGHWPFGMFRTNLFLVGYATAIAAMAFDWAGAPALRWFTAVPVTVLVILPFLVFDRSWNARKKALCYDTDLPLMLEALTAHEPVPKHGEKKNLILSRRTCDTYEYYTDYQPTISRKYRRLLKKTFDVHCFQESSKLEADLPSLVPPNGHAWLLTDMGGPELAGITKHLRRQLELTRVYYALPHKLVQVTPVQ